MESKYSIRGIAKILSGGHFVVDRSSSKTETWLPRHFSLKVRGKRIWGLASWVRFSRASVSGRGRDVLRLTKRVTAAGSAKVSAIATINTGHFANVRYLWGAALACAETEAWRSPEICAGLWPTWNKAACSSSNPPVGSVWPWCPSVVWKRRKLRPHSRSGSLLRGEHTSLSRRVTLLK